MPTSTAHSDTDDGVFDLDVREIATTPGFEPERGGGDLSLLCSIICSNACFD